MSCCEVVIACAHTHTLWMWKCSHAQTNVFPGNLCVWLAASSQEQNNRMRSINFCPNNSPHCFLRTWSFACGCPSLLWAERARGREWLFIFLSLCVCAVILPRPRWECRIGVELCPGIIVAEDVCVCVPVEAFNHIAGVNSEAQLTPIYLIFQRNMLPSSSCVCVYPQFYFIFFGHKIINLLRRHFLLEVRSESGGSNRNVPAFIFPN